jgi:hypothetical protein
MLIVRFHLDILNGNVRLLRVVKRLSGIMCIVTVYLITKPVKKDIDIPIWDTYLQNFKGANLNY